MIARSIDLLRFARTLNYYEKALGRSTSEGFNLFNILGIGHYEVKTHSPLLGELLNPRGSHGLGPRPLELFLKQIKANHFDATTATVSLEHDAGPRTVDEGGRIDLLLTDGKQRQILIENKIYAIDQENQTGRYQRFSEKGLLLYLTLFASAPTNIKGHLPKNLKCISYREDILAWLQECQKEAAAISVVRETITQYINLIKDLTNQNTNVRMNTELTEAVLETEETLRAYYTLKNTEQNIENVILAWLREEFDKSTLEMGFDEIEDMGAFRQKEGGLAFHATKLRQHNLSINFEFEYAGYRGFCVGFAYLDVKKASPAHERIKVLLAQAGLGRVYQSEFWPAWIYWHPYRDWTGETFATIRFGSFLTDAKSILRKLLDIGEQVCEELDSKRK